MSLVEYRKKRNFAVTPEPQPGPVHPRSSHPRSKGEPPQFVVQKHQASHLHYDLRLEIDGVLKSWAVPKGPSLDPEIKRLAVQTEDHPLEYATFEGKIPQGEYGAGEMIVWDRGQWRPKQDAGKSLTQGRIEFTLEGEKLSGRFILIRTRPSSSGKFQWLLKKLDDESARPESSGIVTEEHMDSVLSGNSLKTRQTKPVKKTKTKIS
ncbi:MAG: DNA ligase [Proteobacteria bacterium]|nr:MAG: DNA ligase [Pseudomonadota bacterium]